MVFYRKKFDKPEIRNEKKLRKNEEIRAREVTLIDEKGTLVGKISTFTALDMAKEVNLDLVEVSPNTNPPTCRLMSYGKYLYELKKKQKKQVAKEQKTIRLTFNIALSDLEVRVGQAAKFLEKGHAVRVELVFRGREESHQNLGREKFDIFLESLKNQFADFKIISELKKQGKQLFLNLEPDAKK